MIVVDMENDFVADHTRFWSTDQGPGFKGDYFAAVRKSKPFEASREMRLKA